MADLMITAANVRPNSVNAPRAIVAGETLTAGQPYYRNTSDNKAYKADCDNTLATSIVEGVVLLGGDADDVIIGQVTGDIDLGATLTPGVAYVLSGTAGGICPASDLATGDYITHLGYAFAANSLTLAIKNFGQQVP